MPAILNLVLNGAIAWFLFRKHTTLALWGDNGVGTDLLVTAGLLPFLICSINSVVIRRQLENGKVPPLLRAPHPPTGLALAPGLVRSLVLAAAGVALGALPLLYVIGQLEPLSVNTFVGLKAVWAAALAVAVSLIVAWWVLAAESLAGAGDAHHAESDVS